jgi:4-deoxy-L-threo-5-hexosulose-uronate ketol-isomerase
MFQSGKFQLCYSHYDRLIVGGAMPADGELVLDEVRECGTKSILDRREMVVACVEGNGVVATPEGRHNLAKGDMLYLSMGIGPLTFSGTAKFYILSAPAHTAYPTRLIRIDDAVTVKIGAPETSNDRTIYQFVHPDVMQSCQLVVGMTKLWNGSVWNTMPAHVHDRRSEAYLYIDVPDDARVIHLMGEPEETRHLVMKNHDAVLSPPWSIHAGAGTASYAFIWAMAGDNVDYKDVDMVSMGKLR